MAQSSNDLFAEALEGGRVDLDLDKALACVEKGRAARGQTTAAEYATGEGPVRALFDDADCQGALVPRQGEGQPCVQGWDCTEGLVCQADPPSSAALRCLSPAAEGQACSDPVRVCDVDLACVEEVCQPNIPLNGACDPFGAGAPCVAGTYCDGDTSVCTSLGGPGDPCSVDEACGEDLVCGTAGTCEAPPAPVTDGQACTEADACAALCSVCAPPSAGAVPVCRDRGAEGAYCEADDHCRAPLVCGGGGTCAPAPAVEQPGLGEACDPFGEPCEEGACIEGTCVAGVAGDPCDPLRPGCQDDLICRADGVDPARGECVSAPATGDACIDEQCGPDDFCNTAGQCEALRDPGAGCSDDAQCLSGTCLNAGQCAATAPSCFTSEGLLIEFLLLGFGLPLLRLRRRR